eukprot:SAG31_NODE_22027_length_535_cov_1.158257_1_plen_46_part_00
MLLGEFILNDCRRHLSANLSQRIAKDLIERFAITYFDRLYEPEIV